MVQCDDTTRVKQYRNDHLTSYDVEKKTLLSTNNSLKKQQERLLSQEIKKTCQEKLSEIPTETPTGKKRGARYTHMYNNNRTTSAVRKSSPKELINKSTKRNKSCR